MLRSVSWWLDTDVSGKPIGPIFKGQAFQEELPLKMGPIGCPETSVTNYQLSCITYQRSEGLSNAAAEAGNLALYYTATCSCPVPFGLHALCLQTRSKENPEPAIKEKLLNLWPLPLLGHPLTMSGKEYKLWSFSSRSCLYPLSLLQIYRHIRPTHQKKKKD
jgi:hypothetical protein